MHLVRYFVQQYIFDNAHAHLVWGVVHKGEGAREHLRRPQPLPLP